MPYNLPSYEVQQEIKQAVLTTDSNVQNILGSIEYTPHYEALGGTGITYVTLLEVLGKGILSNIWLTQTTSTLLKITVDDVLLLNGIKLNSTLMRLVLDLPFKQSLKIEARVESTGSYNVNVLYGLY